MTKTDLMEQALKLPAQERLRLAAMLWESGTEPISSSAPEWHWPLVKESLEEHRRDPKAAVAGEGMLRALRQPRA